MILIRLRRKKMKFLGFLGRLANVTRIGLYRIGGHGVLETAMIFASLPRVRR